MMLSHELNRLHDLSAEEMSLEDANAISQQPEAFHLDSRKAANQILLKHYGLGDDE